MKKQVPELDLVPAETDSAKADESIQSSSSKILANERPSYLRSRQIALKKLTSQAGAAGAS